MNADPPQDQTAEIPKSAPPRSWVGAVIGVQCAALLILVAVVIVASSLFDGDDSEDGRESESAAFDPASATRGDAESTPLETLAPIATSSMTQDDDATSAIDEAQAQNSPAKSETKTANKVTSDSDDRTESKPAEQPRKASPPTQASPSPKPQDALKQLPRAVEILDTLQSRDAMVLGRLNMPPGSRLGVELHGGDTAHRVKIREIEKEEAANGRSAQFGQTADDGGRVQYDGIPTFRLKETFDDAGNTYWEFDLTEYRGTIAKLWLADDSLRFQWTDNSARYAESGYLANCVLLISIVQWGQVHSMALRKPIKAEPAPINFVRGTATTEYPVRFMPPEVTLTVETVGATKNLPRPTMGMDRWLTTDRDFTHLKFGDGAPLVVKVLASTKYADSQPRIVTASYYSLPRIAENVSGTLSQLKSVRLRTERKIQFLKGQKTELAKLRPQDARQRSELAKTRREIDRDIRAYQSQLARIKWLEGVTGDSKQPAGIVFRIVHSAGEHTLDLVHGGLP